MKIVCINTACLSITIPLEGISYFTCQAFLETLSSFTHRGGGGGGCIWGLIYIIIYLYTYNGVYSHIQLDMFCTIVSSMSQEYC